MYKKISTGKEELGTVKVGCRSGPLASNNTFFQ